MKTLIELIAKNCEWRKTVNDAYRDQCEERLDKLEKELPSGSGIDCGCKIDRENSGNIKVVISLSFHHMNENGSYNGWTDHVLTITPTLTGNPNMKISGSNRNQIKDYLYEVFDICLCETLVDESTFYQE